MRLTNYKVNFSGVQQDMKTQNHINDIVRSLTPRVPAESSFVLNILDNHKEVTGSFTIISSAVRFSSMKKSDTAINVIDSILEDIVQQIEFWIEKRVV